MEALILKLKELPAEVNVLESDANNHNAAKAFEMTGIKDMCQPHEFEFIDLRYQKDKVKLDAPNEEVWELSHFQES